MSPDSSNRSRMHMPAAQSGSRQRARRLATAAVRRMPLPTARQFFAPKDEQLYWDLATRLWRAPRDYIGLIGAGVTRDLNYPTWSMLMTQLHERANLKTRSGKAQSVPDAVGALTDFPVRAAIYKKLIDDDGFYFRLITNTFGPRPIPAASTVASVVRLPMQVFLTTNYDPSLELGHRKFCAGLEVKVGPAHIGARQVEVCNWTDEARVEGLLGILKAGEDRYKDSRFFVHLHGIYDKPKSIVLTEQDYVTRYIRSQLSAKRLTALLSFNRRLLCLGFSLEDIDLMEVFRQLHGLGGDVPIHTAFLPKPRDRDDIVEAKRQQLQVKYGINAIFYRHLKGHDAHANLKRLIGYLIEPPPQRKEQGGADWRNPSKARGAVGTPSKRRGSAEEKNAPNDRSAGGPTLKQIETQLKLRASKPDPCKGVFGGQARSDGFELTSKVTPSTDPYWYWVDLTVRSTRRDVPLCGRVRLYLHPTFPESRVQIRAKRNRVSKGMWAWGAFTVGAYLQERRLTLELDLAQTNAPAAFRAR